MNATNYTNWNLIKYATVLSLFILLNYLLWSINAWQIIRFVNFFLLFFTFIYFFISKKFNDYLYLKIIIVLLLLISLGTPTISMDARYVYLFSGKIFFYESSLYTFLDGHLASIVTVRPKLPPTLSATFAQLIGFWNEIFPKSTNVILIFPPIIFLISFFKDKVLILLWLFLMLFFSGKLFINGLMDGIIAVYFVASTLIIFKIFTAKIESDKTLLYSIMFLFFAILSLCKNEGIVMILVILISSIFIGFIYEKKINYKLLFTAFVSLCPLFFWKYIITKSNIKFAWLQYNWIHLENLSEYGDPISRALDRITNTEDLFIILHFLAVNEKLILSLIIFIFFALKYYNKNKKLIFFISINLLLYFSALIASFLITPFDLVVQLEASSTRVFIPLVLMMTYFSIFMMRNEYFFAFKGFSK